MNIAELTKEAWRIAKEHGFTDASPEADFALMHSEISEALEDLRNRHGIAETWYEEKVPAFHADGAPIIVDGKQATVAMKYLDPFRTTDAPCPACEGRRIAAPPPPKDGPVGPMDEGHYTKCRKCRGTGRAIVLRKPCGIMSEIADVVIRAAQFSEKQGGDLATAIDEKMEYNETRPYKHGDKAL